MPMKAKRRLWSLLSCFVVCVFGPGPWGSHAPAMASGDVTVSAAVNAPPDFTPGGDITVLEDAGPQTRTRWATDITPGAGEADRTVAFVLKADNPNLFSAQPSLEVAATADGLVGHLSFTPAQDANGSTTVRVWAVDDGGTANGGSDTSEEKTFTITIQPVNDAPIGTDDVLNPVWSSAGPVRIPFRDLLDNDFPGPAAAVDEAEQTLTIVGVSDPVGGTVRIEGTDVVFTPERDFTGAAGFVYSLADDGTPPLTAQAAVSFDVKPRALPPIASDTTTAEDTLSSGGLVIVPDPDDTAGVTHFLVTNITGGTLCQGDGTTRIDDGDFITVAEGAAGLRFLPLPDRNTPAGDRFGFAVQAAVDASGSGLSPAVNVSIYVFEVNDAPTAEDDTLQVVVENAAAFTIKVADLTANDRKGPANEDRQNLTVIAVTPGVGGTPALDRGGQVITFTPASGFTGTASFTYTVSDNGTTNGAPDPRTDTATVRIPVVPLPREPWITPASTREDTQSTSGLVITPNPADGSWVTHFQITGITGGTLYLNDGVTPIADGEVITAAEGGAGLKFTPASDLNSPSGATFTFTVRGALGSDGTGLGAAAGAWIEVSEVNDPPVGADDLLAERDEDSGPWTIPFAALTANDSPGPADEAGQPLTIAAVGDAVHGTVAISGTDVVFTPDLNFHGIATFSYTLADEGTTNGAPDPQIAEAVVTVSIPVRSVNDAPVALDQSLSVTAGATLSGAVTATDVDGDPLTFRVVHGPTLGTVEMNPDGSFTYSSRRTGQDRFTFRANDGTVDSEPATVTVQVTPRSGGHPGGSSGSSRPAAPTAPETPAGGADPEPPGSGEAGDFTGSAAPVSREVAGGEPAEARMLNFQVFLPGGSTTEPLRLQVLSPTANADAVRLAEGAAEFAGTSDVELIRPADGAPVSPVKAVITFEYDPEAVPSPEELRIYYFDTRQNVWVEIGGEVNSQTHTITVQVGHFTTFAALIPRVEAPALPELPAEVRSDRLTAAGAAPAGTPVSLVINGEAQATAVTGDDGRYVLEGRLAEGQNWVYVKGMGALASREWPVAYRPAPVYTDTAGHWAEGAINRLVDLDIATVYGAPLFEPGATVTRLEFAVMVARALGLAPVDEVPAFTDAASLPDWSRAEMAAVVDAGIILGIPDGSFAPDAPVTRAQMAVMLARALRHAGLDTSPGDRRFADHGAIPAWALAEVEAAARCGLIIGYPDGSFRPADGTTRAEAVTMLERLLDQVRR